MAYLLFFGMAQGSILRADMSMAIVAMGTIQSSAELNGTITCVS